MSQQAAENNDKQSNHEYDDMFLRPPLLSSPSQHSNHDETIFQMVCRMFVASRTLRLGTETRFTSIVLWHRFCIAISKAGSKVDPTLSDNNIDKSHMAWMAAACLFLACKTEEEPRRLRDIINVAHMILKDQPTPSLQQQPLVEEDGKPQATPCSTTTAQESDNDKNNGRNICHDNMQVNDDTIQQLSQPPNNPLILRIHQDPPRLDENYWSTKEKIVRAEQIVLRWIGFDFSVSKPHRAVTVILDEPPMKGLLQQTSSDLIVPLAWKKLNDSLFCTRALVHPALELAAAAIALALEDLDFFNVNVNNNNNNNNNPIWKTNIRGSNWWNLLEISDESFLNTKQDLKRATGALLERSIH